MQFFKIFQTKKISRYFNNKLLTEKIFFGYTDPVPNPTPANNVTLTQTSAKQSQKPSQNQVDTLVLPQSR